MRFKRLDYKSNYLHRHIVNHDCKFQLFVFMILFCKII